MKPFDFKSAMKGNKVVTRSGCEVKVICETRGKVFAHVYSPLGRHMDFEAKYNMDGSRWSSSMESPYDLVMAS